MARVLFGFPFLLFSFQTLFAQSAPSAGEDKLHACLYQSDMPITKGGSDKFFKLIREFNPNLSGPFLNQTQVDLLKKTQIVAFAQQWKGALDDAMLPKGRDLTQPALLSQFVLAHYLAKEKIRNLGLDVSLFNKTTQQETCTLLKRRLRNALACSRSYKLDNVPFINLPSIKPRVYFTDEMLTQMDPERMNIQSVVRSNIFIRESASIYSGATLWNELGCGQLSLNQLGLKLVALSKQGITIALNPITPEGKANYRLISLDGVWKEGPGYMNFAYDTFGAMALIHKIKHPSKHLNDHFNNIMNSAVPQELKLDEAMARNLDWLYATQRHNGEWPSQNDADKISSSAPQLLYFVYAMSALNKQFGGSGNVNFENRKKLWCEMVLRNRAESPDYRSTDPNYDLSQYLGSLFEETCGYPIYAKNNLALKSDISISFPLGGQATAFMKSEKGPHIDLHLFNEGSWWMRKDTVYSPPRACNDSSRLPSDIEVCYQRDLSNVFAIREKSKILPRLNNHKRFNDTHFELSFDGFPMLIGPGKSGYIGNGYAYRHIASPNNYNLTKVNGVFPKTLYQSNSDAYKVREYSDMQTRSRVFVMPSDIYDRHVTAIDSKVFIVWDKFKSSTNLASTRINLRSKGLLPQHGKNNNFIRGYLFRSGELFVQNTEDGLNMHQNIIGDQAGEADNLPQKFVRIAPLFDSDVSAISSDLSGVDSCWDEAYDSSVYSLSLSTPKKAKRSKMDHCRHTVVTIGNKSAQHGIGYLVWPSDETGHGNDDSVKILKRTYVKDPASLAITAVNLQIYIDGVIRNVTVPLK